MVARMERIATALAKRVVILLCDLLYLAKGHEWALWREFYRAPGTALELMAADSTSWRVLMEPVPPSFSTSGLSGPYRFVAYGARWSVFHKRDALTSMKRMADELRQRRTERRNCSLA